jgi:hypothetical protein
MKYLEHTLKLYVYNHYNMCNIPIYFCNINIQHLQIPLKLLKYLKYTLATCDFPSSLVRCNIEQGTIDSRNLHLGHYPCRPC